MEANDDRALVKHQEAQLLLPSWDDNDAWALGVWLRARAADEQLPLVIDVRRFDRPLFYAALPGPRLTISNGYAAKPKQWLASIAAAMEWAWILLPRARHWPKNTIWTPPNTQPMEELFP